MPQDVPFLIPFTATSNPDVVRAQRANCEWVREFSLVADDAAGEHLLAWDIAGLMSGCLPFAEGPDLDLAVDAMTIGILADDQFDSERGVSPATAASLVDRLIAVMESDFVSKSSEHLLLETALADVRVRLAEGMSQAWVDRTTSHWDAFFRAFFREAENRSNEAEMSTASYLSLRRDSGNVFAFIDLIERVGGFEVPEPIYSMSQLRTLRILTSDVINTINDIHSLEKEEAQGDLHNLVTVIQRENSCPRGEAIITVRNIVNGWIRQVDEMTAALPEAAIRIGLDEVSARNMSSLGEGMKAAIRGYHDWSNNTARYSRGSHPTPTADRNGYLEDLMVPRARPGAGGAGTSA